MHIGSNLYESTILTSWAHFAESKRNQRIISMGYLMKAPQTNQSVNKKKLELTHTFIIQFN
jgi:hypothetical protein